MAIQRISYIFHDTSMTEDYWEGYTEDFDDTVISIADKMALEVDKRTVQESDGFIKFIIVNPVV